MIVILDCFLGGVEKFYVFRFRFLGGVGGLIEDVGCFNSCEKNVFVSGIFMYNSIILFLKSYY